MERKQKRNVAKAGLALSWLLLGFPLLPPVFVTALIVEHVTVVLVRIPPFVVKIVIGRVLIHLFCDLLVNAVGVRSYGCVGRTKNNKPNVKRMKCCVGTSVARTRCCRKWVDGGLESC